MDLYEAKLLHDGLISIVEQLRSLRGTAYRPAHQPIDAAIECVAWAMDRLTGDMDAGEFDDV